MSENNCKNCCYFYFKGLSRCCKIGFKDLSKTKPGDKILRDECDEFEGRYEPKFVRNRTQKIVKGRV